MRAAEQRLLRVVAERIRDPQRVPFLPRRMAGRDVERLEVVVIGLDLWALDRLETHRGEDARDLADRRGHGMQSSDVRRSAGKCEVHAVAKTAVNRRAV